MENKLMKNDQQAFLDLSQKRDYSDRMNRLFAQEIGEEDVSRREAAIKHFDLGANRFQAVVFPEPVHFRLDGEDSWKEIDNTLKETMDAKGRQVYRNSENRIHIEVPAELDGDDMISVSSDGKTLAWRFEEEAQPVKAVILSGEQLKRERLAKLAMTMPKYAGRTFESLMEADLESEIESEQEKRSDIATLSAQVLFNDALPGVSVRYTLYSEQVKEDIILANEEALAKAAIRLSGDFNYLVDDGCQLIAFDKADGAEAFRMSRPVIYDANGKSINAVPVLTDCGDYIRLEYDVDPEFLKNAAYPVTIDPVISSTNAVHNIQDVTIRQNQSSYDYKAGQIYVGKNSSSVTCVGLLKFNELAVPKACDTVIGAVLNMVPKSSSSSKYIGAYEVYAPWQSSTVTWQSLNPSTNVSTYAQECLKGASSGSLQFDLTNLYRKWCTYTGTTSNNNGVAFQTPAGITGSNFSEIYSSDASNTSYRPVMYVNYVSHAGLESWWQYDQMSADRAGTVYSDLFNGNMVLAHSDTVMTGNRNPVSVNHYYNSCLSTENNYGCGFGWKTDAHQKVTLVTHNSKSYFVWEDGDGTQHFFEWTGSQPYKDCEGMELELTYSSSGGYIIITDKETNQMRFNVVQTGLAWLAMTRDACDNRAVYTYVSGHETEGRIDKITDPVGRVTQFAYNSDGSLASIRVPAAAANTYDYVYYTYDSSKRLTGIRYSALGGSTPQTTFAYEGSTKLLAKARYVNGKQVNIAYEATSLYGSNAADDARRVLSLEEVATNSSGTVLKYGAKKLIDYGTMVTNVTIVENTASNAGKKLYYQFNDSGNVVCVRDELGFANFTRYSSGIENTPSEESRMYKAVINRLRRPDFSDQWTPVQAGGTVALDANNRCLNLKSVKMTKTAAGEAKYRQQTKVEAQQPFTFSAYLKASNLVQNALFDSGAYLRISDLNGNILAASKPLSGSTESAVGNDLPTDGWERISVTLPAQTSAMDIYADLVCDAISGTAWFACPQLETGVVANTFNMVSNGDFRYFTDHSTWKEPSDWGLGADNLQNAANGVIIPSASDNFPSALEGNFAQVEGIPNKTNIGYRQYFDIAGNSGDVFVVGGWADGKSIPKATTRNRCFAFGLALKKKSDGSWIDPKIYAFNEEWVDWQQCCYAAVAGFDYTQVALYILYAGECNSARFSNVFLYREAYGSSFGYDDKGNMLSASNLAGQKSKATYDSANNMITYIQPGRDNTAQNQYQAYYGSTDADKKKHLPWRTRTPMNVMDYFSYDTYGNVTSTRRLDYRVYTGNTSESAYPYIRTENTYTDDGNYGKTTKDARGNVVTQAVNANTGTLTSVTDPAGQTVNYTYDALRRVTKVETSSDGKTYQNGYTYENDRLKTVAHNTTSNTSNDVVYTFGYDDLGRKTTVKVGSAANQGQTLSTNVYEENRTGLLKEVDYGNGGKVKYGYDAFDRLTEVRYDNETTPRYEYKYGANGQVAEVQDNNLNRTAKTFYDLANRPSQNVLRDENGNMIYSTRLLYDKQNNLKQFAESLLGGTETTDYTYDRDNRVTSVNYNGSTVNKTEYTYDALGRMTTRKVAGQTSTYAYTAGGYGTNSTTPLVSGITQPHISYAYTYDNRGNITGETRNGLTITYEYDAIGQLVRVNDPIQNETWAYTYDRGGNILSKKRYAYTTGTLGTALQTIPYVYSDSNWKDKLTSYNGQSITYDAIGNPLNDGTWTYQWQAGRQLKQMSGNGKSISLQYNHDGLRVKKTVTDTTGTNTHVTKTDYTLNGKMVVGMTVQTSVNGMVESSDILHFFYDGQGQPAMVRYNGSMYTYLKNLQGDIVGIVDSNGNLVVEYRYDAWGKPLSKAGSLASTLGTLNPFRYRGYVYDEETGLYYLRSRYYNSNWCRFINSDIVGVALFDNYQLENRNCFSYCDNEPVLRMDDTGTFWNIVIGALVGAAVSAAVSVVTQLVTTKTVDVSQVIVATVGGAISGGFAATGIKVHGQEIVNTVIGGVSSMANYYLDTAPEEFSAKTMLLEGAKGAAAGFISGKVGGNGTGSKHLTSSRKALTKAINKGKPIKKALKYWYSQTRRESIRNGEAAIPAIIKASIPGAIASLVY